MRPDSLNRPWTVGDLVGAVGQSIAAQYNPVRVTGEISGFTRAVSGHCYFSLKDAQGQLRCAMFKRAADGLVNLPKNGDQVEVFGRLDVYVPRGDLQLVVETLKSAGQGDLYERFLQLKAKLQAQGLFEASRKRARPNYPRHVGVVTSLGAAALHDVVTALARRTPHLAVTVFPAAVQGAQAPLALVQAIRRAASALRDGRLCDVILLVRGGGSLEDLWAFNDEGVAIAIADSPIPVITGVGHETDFTIADFVSDLRAPTPTAAAELVSDSTAELMAAIQSYGDAMGDAVRSQLDREAQRCDRLANRLTRPSQRINLQQQRLAQLTNRLTNALQRQVVQRVFALRQSQQRWLRSAGMGLSARRQRLENIALRWEGASPKAALERGYAWVQGPDGHALQSVNGVTPGEPLRLIMRDGELGVSVSTVLPD